MRNPAVANGGNITQSQRCFFLEVKTIVQLMFGPLTYFNAFQEAAFRNASAKVSITRGGAGRWVGGAGLVDAEALSLQLRLEAHDDDLPDGAFRMA